MDYPRLSKIKEIDCGRDTEEVDEALSQGWVLLKIRLKDVEAGDGVEEMPIYILGFPKNG